MTDLGLVASLRNEKHIVLFTTSGDCFTGAGIAAALAPSRGQLRRLRLRGQRAAPSPLSGQRPSWSSCYAALRALPDGVVDVEELCQMQAGFLGFDGPVCKRMCTFDGACTGCGATCCEFHEKCVQSCQQCGVPVCSACSEHSGTVYGVCDGCVMAAEEPEEPRRGWLAYCVPRMRR